MIENSFRLLFHKFVLLTMLELIAGGILALYAHICRRGKLGLFPNHQAADEEISTYHDPGHSNRNAYSSPLKNLIQRRRRARAALLVFVLFGVALFFTVGVLTPAISGKCAFLPSMYFWRDLMVLSSC